MSEEKAAPTAAAPQATAADKPTAAAKSPTTVRRTRAARAATTPSPRTINVGLEPTRHDPFQAATRVWPD